LEGHGGDWRGKGGEQREEKEKWEWSTRPDQVRKEIDAPASIAEIAVTTAVVDNASDQSI